MSSHHRHKKHIRQLQTGDMVLLFALPAAVRLKKMYLESWRALRSFVRAGSQAQVSQLLELRKRI